MEIKIRPLILEDAYTSVKWRNDDEVFRYTGNRYAHEITLQSELEWIKKVICNPNEYRCAIIVDNIYVGNIYLTDITTMDATYHIFIGEKSYWGKGVAKKASLLILNYALEHLHLSYVNLKVRVENKTAIGLYKSLGFESINSDSEFITMKRKL